MRSAHAERLRAVRMSPEQGNTTPLLFKVPQHLLQCLLKQD
jgi:hypothetical protein